MRKDKMEVTILGCGNSTGVPAIGNYWGDCDPTILQNTRTRSSLWVKKGSTNIIIDTGPDFRNHYNNENISDITAVFYSHHHSDHTAGMDELRVLKHRLNRNLIPCYMNRQTFEDLKQRFDYLFSGGDHTALYPPIVETHILDEKFGKEIEIGDLSFIPFEQDHGTCNTIGYRFGDIAYSVDMYKLDAKAIDTLRGVKIWIVDAAAYNQDNNPVHANLKTIYDLNKKIGAQEVYLTSMSIAMDYQTLCNELPNGYFPAYDGLKFELF